MTDTSNGTPGAVTIYSTSWCPWCDRAKTLLSTHGVDYTDVNIEQWADPRSELETRTGRRTVPQIFIGGTHVGGFDDLADLAADGTLMRLCADENIPVRT